MNKLSNIFRVFMLSLLVGTVCVCSARADGPDDDKIPAENPEILWRLQRAVQLDEVLEDGVVAHEEPIAVLPIIAFYFGASMVRLNGHE